MPIESGSRYQHIYRRIIYSASVIASVISVPICAEPGIVVNPSVAQRLTEAVISERYEAALQVADSVIQANPSHPAGYFLRATVLNNRTIDYEDELDLADYNANVAKAVELCDARIESGGAGAEEYFILGAVHSFEVYRHFREGDWLSGLLRSAKIGANIAKAIDADSTYWDAYFILGAYLYYRSQRAGLLRTAGLVSDRRSEGIAYLELAARRGVFTIIPATAALCWIEIEQGDHQAALDRIEPLAQRHPASRSLLWKRGRALVQLNRRREAAAVYSRVLRSVSAESRNNHFNEISCLHALASLYAEMGEWQLAADAAARALDLKVSPQVARRKKNNLEHLEKLHKQAISHIEEAAENYPVKDQALIGSN